MSTIIITKEAHDLIRSAAVQPFKETGHRLPDGSIEIDLSDEVFERLDGQRLEGETFSDTVVRLCSLARSGGRGN